MKPGYQKIQLKHRQAEKPSGWINETRPGVEAKDEIKRKLINRM
ncbi:MAG: hypothetical protein Q8868_09405 [Bacteroidota bacterium]|nr:hypothetical protein [Bacteroidota bacterium]